ncbi:MAG TPA: hypothetical protein VEB86_14515 [Chryseosolibacter sp.]|nr:hypothetical protein [Chryseosolibacter sp.]
MNIFVIILNVSLAGFFCHWLARRQERKLRIFFWPALSAKISAGIFLGVLYHDYYQTGDTILYHRDARVLAGLAVTDPSAYLKFLVDTTPEISGLLSFSDPRAIFFDKLASVPSLLTQNNYWLMAGYFSLLSFLGAWYLLVVISRYYRSLILPAAIAFLFFPSVVFWTSGLIKESLASAALFTLAGVFLTAWFEGRVRAGTSVAAIACVWLLWGLKYYFVAVFAPVVAACLLYKFVVRPVVRPQRPMAQVILWLGLFLVPLALITLAHPNFYVNKVMDVIASNHEMYRLYSHQEDLIRMYDLQPDLWSILKNAPVALGSGLYRPFIFEAGNGLQFAASIENLVLVILTLTSLRALIYVRDHDERILLTAIVVHVVLLCVLITLSTPNFGTLSRYRVGYLPFFVFLLLAGSPLTKFFERKFFGLVRSR